VHVKHDRSYTGRLKQVYSSSVSSMSSLVIKITLSACFLMAPCEYGHTFQHLLTTFQVDSLKLRHFGYYITLPVVTSHAHPSSFHRHAGETCSSNNALQTLINALILFQSMMNTHE